MFGLTEKALKALTSRHWVSMPVRCFPGEVFQARPSEKRPQGRPRTLARECFGIPFQEPVGYPLLSLVPRPR